jgi:hypothetical protein
VCDLYTKQEQKSRGSKISEKQNFQGNRSFEKILTFEDTGGKYPHKPSFSLTPLLVLNY